MSLYTPCLFGLVAFWSKGPSLRRVRDMEDFIASSMRRASAKAGTGYDEIL